ncbi:MAG: DUF1254 domain-containing protein [Bdellovibrio sp.]
MQCSKRFFLSFLLAFGCVACASTQDQARATPQEIQELAKDVYIYAYPLVVASVAREVETAVPRAGERRAPLNHFAHMRVLPTDKFTAMASPNVDTLYSTAWLDVSQEPIILSIPESNGRYFMIPLLSAWTNVFAAPGVRTTGTQKAEYAITGPGWDGALPSNVKQIRAPTNIVWVLGRVYTKGPSDQERAYAFQDRLKLTPLSQFRKTVDEPSSFDFNLDVDAKTPPAEQVDRMDARNFFALFATELKKNPPSQDDRGLLQKMARLGIVPGKDFSYSRLNTESQRALNQGYFAGQERLIGLTRSGQARAIQGWSVSRVLGAYGLDYDSRAVVAKIGLGANTKQDILYPRAVADSTGHTLNGGYKYVLRFSRNQLPPVNSFWSLTVYNSRQQLIKNDLSRYALSDRDKLKFNPDGSVDIFFQATNPGKGKESNWLPTPDGEDFNVIMRLYWPKQAALDGSWKVPGIQKVQEFKKLSDNLR